MKLQSIKLLSAIISITLLSSISTVTYAKGSVETEKKIILSLGSDLTVTQKDEMINYFNVSKDTKTISITDEVIISQLGLDPSDPSNYSGGCYSSAYIDVSDNVETITVTSHNLTEVTNTMLMNAIITTGIPNANVKVSAPFPVTGTAALAGILEGIEGIGGFEISLNQKETAQKEIETTMELSEEIGSLEASTVINDIKASVIKKDPKDQKDLEKIVNNSIKDYDIELSEESKQSIILLMSSINDLDLNYSELKDSLSSLSDGFKDKLASIGSELANSGVFDKISSWFSDKWSTVKSFVSSIVNKDADTSQEGIASGDKVSITSLGNVTSNVTSELPNMEIHYLDAGQGDSTYIKVNDFDILIDAGDNGGEKKLLSQLKEFTIDDFELVIATHPHADHIGGMEEVFKEYVVESIYMPKVEHTTKTFEKMIMAIQNEGILINQIKEGTSFDFGPNANMEVFSPISETYEEFNDYSPIMKLTYGNNSFIFTGDAESHAENEVVMKYPSNLEADVLKFGHHGSSTSSTEDFVKSVSPTWGVISCGLDNKYGHPHKETLEKIERFGINSYRTDLQGQISLISNGSSISISSER